jgi:hypothetical protein
LTRPPFRYEACETSVSSPADARPERIDDVAVDTKRVGCPDR